MNSLRIFNRQAGIFAVAGALLFAVILPTIVGAAQLTERSIALSSSSKSATDVSYTIKFKSGGVAAGAVVIDFCENSPLIGDDCDAPAGFVATGADNGGTIDATAHTAIVTQTIAANTATTVELAGITNPSAVGPMYARIITYNTPENAALYNAEQTIGQDANRIDEGGAAISITDTIGVSGAVLESLTFCVAGNNNIGENCTPVVVEDGLDAPTLKLGQQFGEVFALVPGTVSEGSIYTQLSTNAIGGAVVSLKSSTTGCGGLLRVGFTDAATQCDIKPAGITGGVTGAEAKFGVKTSDSTPVGAASTGTLVPSGSYNNSTFVLGWVSGNATGVTSTFGDPFFNTNNAPANNRNMTITFGASATNATPAGMYSADLSLIATGKF